MFLIRKQRPSAGATALRNAMREAGQSAGFTENDSFRQRHLILNWGGDSDPVAPNSRVLNSQAARRVAMNKVTTFTALATAGVSIPQFFTNAEDAATYRGALPARNNPIILARSTATGESGAGINVIRMGENIPEGMPLYVQYVRKYAEYRAHIIAGECVIVQQKRAREGEERTEDQQLIRNHANGWVFATENVDDHSDAVGSLGVLAAAALSLDVAAIDIIRGRDNQLYVLEANTKPGLDSPTVLAAYVRKLTSLHP